MRAGSGEALLLHKFLSTMEGEEEERASKQASERAVEKLGMSPIY